LLQELGVDVSLAPDQASQRLRLYRVCKEVIARGQMKPSGVYRNAIARHRLAALNVPQVMI
jgi:hypothetical protein